MKIFFKTLLGLLVLLLGLMIFLVMWVVIAHPMLSRLNQPEYELLTIPGQVYRLPVRQYNMWVQPYSAKTDQAAFGFELILPNLAPSTTDPAETAQWGNGTGWHRQLHVFMQYYVDPISQQKMADSHFEDGELYKHYDMLHPPMKPRKYLDPKKYTVLDNGCRKYEGTMPPQILLECGTGESMWVTTCQLNVPSPSCQSLVSFGHKMQLEYAYGYNFLNQNVEIHDDLIKLIKSFRVQN